MSIGCKLLFLRKKSGLSQDQLGEECFCGADRLLSMDYPAL
jgi:hypothetical protein